MKKRVLGRSRAPSDPGSIEKTACMRLGKGERFKGRPSAVEERRPSVQAEKTFKK